MGQDTKAYRTQPRVHHSYRHGPPQLPTWLSNRGTSSGTSCSSPPMGSIAQNVINHTAVLVYSVECYKVGRSVYTTSCTTVAKKLNVTGRVLNQQRSTTCMEACHFLAHPCFTRLPYFSDGFTFRSDRCTHLAQRKRLLTRYHLGTPTNDIKRLPSLHAQDAVVSAVLLYCIDKDDQINPRRNHGTISFWTFPETWLSLGVWSCYVIPGTAVLVWFSTFKYRNHLVRALSVNADIVWCHESWCKLS